MELNEEDKFTIYFEGSFSKTAIDQAKSEFYRTIVLHK
jgi:hypothetical protein